MPRLDRYVTAVSLRPLPPSAELRETVDAYIHRHSPAGPLLSARSAALPEARAHRYSSRAPRPHPREPVDGLMLASQRRRCSGTSRTEKIWGGKCRPMVALLGELGDRSDAIPYMEAR